MKMNAPEKPFACKSEGCKMSFTNEDHLMVHTKKHDMNLNLGLGMKTNIFVADQTPTPTRFIRNCEEVGLFQDLQNVNPFEETFRRATELVKSGNMTVVPNINGSSDDTLHTPHVFPLMNSNFNETQQRNDSPMIIQSSTEFDLKTPAIRNETLADANNVSNNENHNKNTQFEELKHDLELEKIQNSIENDCIEVITMTGLINQIKSNEKQKNSNKTNKSTPKKTCIKKAVDSTTNTTAKTSTKQKLKANILKNKTSVKNNPIQIINTLPNVIRLPQTHLSQAVTLAPIVQNPIIVNNPYILSSTNQMYTVIGPPVVQTLPQRPIKNNLDKKSTKNTEKKSNLSKDEEQQQKIKVRNRAAQERARKKHKLWINNLVKQNEAFLKTNTILNNEIKSLKEEVAKLQTALLAHADCEVTKSSGDKSLIENLIKTNQVSQKHKLESTPSSESTTVTMKKIRPNIKPLSLPTITFLDRNMFTHSNGSSTLIPQTLVNNVSNVLVPVTVQKIQNLTETKKIHEVIPTNTKLSDKIVKIELD